MGVLGSIYIYLPSSDGNTHRGKVEQFYLGMHWPEFIKGLTGLITLNDSYAPPGITDPYLHIISFIAGAILGLPDLLHIISSFIYGLIYFSIIKIFYQRISWPQGITLIHISFFIFVIYRGFSGMNSIRWWTAFWLLLYGLMGFWHYGKKKYLLIALLSPYIHFSFIAFVVPTFAAIWLYRQSTLVIVIWLLSFGVAGNYQLIQSYIPDLEVINRKAQHTLNEEFLAASLAGRSGLPQKEKRFYTEYGQWSFNSISIPLLIVFLFLYRKYVSSADNDLASPLFAAGVLLYSFGNFFEFSPSVYGRSLAGSGPFILASSLLTLSQMSIVNFHPMKALKSKALLLLFYLSSIPMILFHLSYTLGIFSIYAVIIPFVSWFLGSEDISIIEFIKLILLI